MESNTLRRTKHVWELGGAASLRHLTQRTWHPLDCQTTHVLKRDGERERVNEERKQQQHKPFPFAFVGISSPLLPFLSLHLLLVTL